MYAVFWWLRFLSTFHAHENPFWWSAKINMCNIGTNGQLPSRSAPSLRLCDRAVLKRRFALDLTELVTADCRHAFGVVLVCAYL